jgi:ribosomal-protein-alanine N-acetyltransferase
VPSDQRIFRSSRQNDQSAVSTIFEQGNLMVPIKENPESGAPPQMGSTHLYVCEFHRRAVGAIHWRYLGGEAEILDLAVARKYRRAGHGKFLLANFLRLAIQHRVNKIFLEVRESNSAAIALYRQFGFSISGRRPNYYRDPIESALLLDLRITG